VPSLHVSAMSPRLTYGGSGGTPQGGRLPLSAEGGPSARTMRLSDVDIAGGSAETCWRGITPPSPGRAAFVKGDWTGVALLRRDGRGEHARCRAYDRTASVGVRLFSTEQGGRERRGAFFFLTAPLPPPTLRAIVPRVFVGSANVFLKQARRGDYSVSAAKEPGRHLHALAFQALSA